MAETLNEFDRGFNAGIDAAVEFHERFARAADKASSFVNFGALGPDEPLSREACLNLIRVMSVHRGYGNAIRRLRKLTDAEKAEADRIAELLDR